MCGHHELGEDDDHNDGEDHDHDDDEDHDHDDDEDDDHDDGEDHDHDDGEKENWHHWTVGCLECQPKKSLQTNRGICLIK